MIKHQEAYDYLLGLLELEDDIRWPLVKESMSKFKELVDKATPKEPIKNRVEYNSPISRYKGFIYCCPACNIVVDRDFNYCCECGQALDRSEENDKN